MAGVWGLASDRSRAQWVHLILPIKAFTHPHSQKLHSYPNKPFTKRQGARLSGRDYVYMNFVIH